MHQSILRSAVVSRRFGLKVLGLGVGLLALAWSLPAYASGPDYQTVNPTYDSVVQVLYNAVVGSGVGTFNGTGEIVQNTEGADDNGFFEILTADHVVSATGTFAAGVLPNLGISFGNDPVTPPLAGASTFNDYNAVNVWRWGSTGTEDIAVMNVDYGTYNPAYNADVISLTPAYHLDSNNNIVQDMNYFSDIGFGNQGKLAAGKYVAQGNYGTQRFLTDSISNIAANFAGPGGYTYNSDQFTVKNPQNIAQAGTGAGFDGDSGSPMLTSDPVNVTINVPNTPYTNYNGNTPMSYYTDDESAVFTFGPNTLPNIAFGSTEGGVALSQADINWIMLHGTEAYLPEPTALILLPAAMLLALRRNRRAA
jgi:hypothetical protein